MSNNYFKRIDNRLVLEMEEPKPKDYGFISDYEYELFQYNFRPSYAINPADDERFNFEDSYEKDVDFVVLDGGHGIPMAYPKSCDKSCGPGDYRKGGKCDLNGCYEENLVIAKDTGEEKEESQCIVCGKSLITRYYCSDENCIGYINPPLPSITERERELMKGFAEWASNNQFTQYNDIWTSTKIHYSPDKYTTDQLIDIYLETLNKKV